MAALAQQIAGNDIRGEPSGADVGSPRYKDASAIVEDRIADLLSRMTVEEKADQLCSIDLIRLPTSERDVPPPSPILGLIQVDVNTIGSATGSQNLATSIRHLQQAAVSGTRLGIPILFHGLHRGGEPHAQVSPAPLAIAASWQPNLARQLAAVEATQMRRIGIHLMSGAVLTIADDPRHPGFGMTFGEDPHLVSEMGVAVIAGLQGTTDQKSVLAKDKVWAAATHFAARSLPANDSSTPLPLGNRELHERILAPFVAAIARGGVSAIVAARAEFDALPLHGNKQLLHDVLRAELDFKGLSLAEPQGIADLHTVYGVSSDLQGATRLAFSAGIDAGLPAEAACAALAQSVRDGGIAQTRFDTAVRRVLDLKFRAGLFEQPFASFSTQKKSVSDHLDLFLNAARSSIVLLKNDGALPLHLNAMSRKEHIAVVTTKSRAADTGNVATDIADRLRAEDRATVEVVRLAEIRQPSEVLRAASIVVLLCDDAQMQMATCELPEYAAGSGRRALLVLTEASSPVTPSLVDRANAVIAAWNLGTQAAQAIADVIIGTVSPSGKLPVSIPRSAGRIPVQYNAKPSARRGYLFDSAEPLFAFGWGLSYASIELSAPRLAHSSVSDTDNIQVFVDVHNTSNFPADETVQLYVRSKANAVTRPVKELRAFRRVHLSAHEQKTVSLTFPVQSLAQWDVQMQRVLISGAYEIMVGANSQQLQSAMVTVQRGSDK